MFQSIRLTLILVLSAVLSTGAFAGSSYHSEGYHGYHHGMAHHKAMNFDALRDNVALDDNQLALLAQLEAAHQDVMNLLTNLQASSLNSDGEFDHDLFMSQLQDNSYLLEQRQNLLSALVDTLSDEQKAQWHQSMGSCGAKGKAAQ